MALQFEIRHFMYELKRPDCFHGCNGKVFGWNLENPWRNWMKVAFGTTPWKVVLPFLTTLFGSKSELWGRKPVAEFPAAWEFLRSKPHAMLACLPWSQDAKLTAHPTSWGCFCFGGGGHFKDRTFVLLVKVSGLRFNIRNPVWKGSSLSGLGVLHMYTNLNWPTWGCSGRWCAGWLNAVGARSYWNDISHVSYVLR